MSELKIEGIVKVVGETQQVSDKFKKRTFVVTTSDQYPQEVQFELMQDGFRIAMEDVAWVPLYVPKCTYGIADYIAWNPRPNMMLAVEDMGFK